MRSQYGSRLLIVSLVSSGQVKPYDLRISELRPIDN